MTQPTRPASGGTHRQKSLTSSLALKGPRQHPAASKMLTSIPARGPKMSTSILAEQNRCQHLFLSRCPKCQHLFLEGQRAGAARSGPNQGRPRQHAPRRMQRFHGTRSAQAAGSVNFPTAGLLRRKSARAGRRRAGEWSGFWVRGVCKAGARAPRKQRAPNSDTPPEVALIIIIMFGHPPEVTGATCVPEGFAGRNEAGRNEGPCRLK